MALAILEPDDLPGDDDDARRWFRYDIGSSRFFRLALGGPERRRLDGVSLIDRPTWVSPLEGPIAESAMGRGRYGIDEARFQDDAEFVQMMSYRTATREGPAVSAIVRARRPLPRDLAPARLTPPRLPVPMSRQQSSTTRRPSAPAVNQLSFMDILGALAPVIGNLLGGLGGGAQGTAAPSAPAGTGGDILARLADPATIRLLTQLVSQIGGVSTGATATAASTALAGRRSDATATASALGYSTAMIAPALLAALPALMPLLQQVLNPQTIQTLVDAPNRTAQTVINGVNDVLKIGVQADQNFMEHLRALNPGVDDPALDRLMESMGLSLAGGARRAAYLRTSRVRLAFDGLQSVTVAGENRILFAHDRAIVLPMRVETPSLKSGKPARLTDPELLLEVKDPVGLRVHKRVRSSLPPITGSGPIGAVTLPADAVASLEPGRDWLLCVTLTWRAPRRAGGRPGDRSVAAGTDRLGACMTTLVHLAGPLVFDGLSDEGEAIDLADPDRYRALWHRLWAGRFAPEAKRFDAEIDYAYSWDPAAADVRREDTQIRTKPADGSVASVVARVKGGLAFSPAALADAAASFDPDMPPLGADARAALADPAVAARLGLGARLRVKFRGREGEAFALWVYPAVRRATLALAAPATILETGNITTLSPRPTPFVVPVALNVIGTRAR